MSLSRKILIFVLIAAFMTVSLSAQENEMTNDGFTLTILEDGDTVEETFTDAVSARLYAFNATAGDQITIAMMDVSDSPEVSVDPYLVLLGSAGEVIASDDDSGDNPLDALIETELPASGSYYILATTFADLRFDTPIATDDEGDATEVMQQYALTLTGNTQPTDLEDYDPETVDVFQGEMSIGDSFEGYSNIQEPVFYVIFEGEAGQVIDISLISEDFDTILYVFADGGDRIAFNDDGPESTNSAINGLELPVTQEYIIFATSYFFVEVTDDMSEDEFGGDFQLTITEN